MLATLAAFPTFKAAVLAGALGDFGNDVFAAVHSEFDRGDPIEDDEEHPLVVAERDFWNIILKSPADRPDGPRRLIKPEAYDTDIVVPASWAGLISHGNAQSGEHAEAASLTMPTIHSNAQSGEHAEGAPSAWWTIRKTTTQGPPTESFRSLSDEDSDESASTLSAPAATRLHASHLSGQDRREHAPAATTSTLSAPATATVAAVRDTSRVATNAALWGSNVIVTANMAAKALSDAAVALDAFSSDVSAARNVISVDDSGAALSS